METHAADTLVSHGASTAPQPAAPAAAAAAATNPADGGAALEEGLAALSVGEGKKAGVVNGANGVKDDDDDEEDDDEDGDEDDEDGDDAPRKEEGEDGGEEGFSGEEEEYEDDGETKNKICSPNICKKRFGKCTARTCSPMDIP